MSRTPLGRTYRDVTSIRPLRAGERMQEPQRAARYCGCGLNAASLGVAVEAKRSVSAAEEHVVVGMPSS